MTDWAKIRREYIKGGTSYRKLAAKYGIPRSNIERKGREEKWSDLKSQANCRSMAKTVDAVSDLNADVDSNVHDAALDLLAAFRKSVKGEKDMSAAQLKDYGAALKSIQTVLTNGPTELDIREQEARIANLRRQADSSGGADTAKLIVEGLPEEFTV